MGLFDKKFCDICGEKIGLLGNRKLSDGNLCKDCARQLSPWMTDRRTSSVEEIGQHLAYRAENQQAVNAIQPTRILGNSTKVYIDERSQRFFVTRQSDWRGANPDILDISQVIDTELAIDEDKKEIYREGEDGKRVSFDPPRYETSYRFDVLIRVNSPYFDQIAFELTEDRPDSPYTDAYREYERQADELRRALKPTPAAAAAPAQPAPTQEPKGWVCACGAANEGKFCGECGAQRPAAPKQRCDSCGWQPADPANPPKFCPECGTAFQQ